MEGLLDVRAPVLFIKAVLPIIKTAGVAQLFAGRRKVKGAVFVKGRKLRHKFALELIAQDFYRDKKITGGFAELPIRSKPAAGDDAVHVHMISQFLIPGVEDLDNAGFCAEILLIRGQFQEGLCTAGVEEAVEEVLVGGKERVEFMREGEDHME